VPLTLQQHNFINQDNIPGFAGKSFHTSEAPRTLTIAHLDDIYSNNQLLHTYTDRSASNAVYDRGGRVLFRYPEGSEKTTAIPIGKRKAEYATPQKATNMLRDDPGFHGAKIAFQAHAFG